DVRAAPLRGADPLRHGEVDDLGATAAQPIDQLGELADGPLVWVPEVEHLAGPARPEHGAHHALDEVGDVAERPGLAAVAVDRNRLADQRLADERRHDPPVVGVRVWAVAIEDAD